MRRALPTVLVAVTALVVAAVPGGANSSTHSDPSGDLFNRPVGVNASSVDLVRATAGHSRGRLVHTVSTAGSIPSPSSGLAPVLFLEHPTQPNNGMAECAYIVGRRGSQYGVFKCGGGKRVASLRMTRTSSRTIRYEFSPNFLNNPENYEWAARTRSRTEYSASSWVDRLPSGNNEFITHTLR